MSLVIPARIICTRLNKTCTLRNISTAKNLWNIHRNNSISLTRHHVSYVSCYRFYSVGCNPENEKQKLSLYQRLKKLYREYWYVLLPVHFITSAVWFGGFYYAAKSGVDIVSAMEWLGFSERFIKPFKDSSMGYVAVAYGLYKIATPLRYTVTLGGTTICIKYLKEFGYIKPVPNKERLKEMLEENKEKLKQKTLKKGKK